MGSGVAKQANILLLTLAVFPSFEEFNLSIGNKTLFLFRTNMNNSDHKIQY